MASIKFRDLLYSAQKNPRELGYYSEIALLLECLDKVLSEGIDVPQRVEVLECRLIQELTKGCIEV